MVQYYCADLTICKRFIYNCAILWGAIKQLPYLYDTGSTESKEASSKLV